MRTTLAAVVTMLLAATASLSAQAPTAARGADSAYFRGDYATALAGYTALVRRDTADATAWFRIGVSHHMLGHFRDALAALINGRRLGFQAFSVQLRIARAYARLGDRSSALMYLDSVVAGAAASGAGPALIRDEPDFVSLNAEPRFVDLVARLAAARYPCPGGAQTTQFDFWIGIWNVSPWNAPAAAPAAAGVNDVHPILEHCVIFENWTGTVGGSGKSFNYFDTNVGKWRQIWVADGGGSLDYTGEFRDGAMRFDGWTLGTNGQRVLQKLTFTPFGRDTVRQTFESSTDGGKTWTTGFDGRYVRQTSP